MLKIDATYRQEADGAETIFSDDDMTITRKGHGFSAYDTETRRDYLVPFGYVPRRSNITETPLERMIRRGQI